MVCGFRAVDYPKLSEEELHKHLAEAYRRAAEYLQDRLEWYR